MRDDDTWLPFVDSLVDVAEDSVSGLCLSLFAFVEASDDFGFGSCGAIVALAGRLMEGLDSVVVLRTDGARVGRGILNSCTHFFCRVSVEVPRQI